MPRMRKWVTVLVFVCLSPLSACEGEHGTRERLATATMPPVPFPVQATVAVSLPQESAADGRSSSRTIDSDLDADGIADYRITVIETFDAEGKLIRRTEEEDFEADGIVDSRVTTSFADSLEPVSATSARGLLHPVEQGTQVPGGV